MTNESLVTTMRACRHAIHSHPETAFEEHQTAKLIAKELRKADIEVHESIGKTGMVAVLRNGEGPSIGLRADMDALPIAEENNFSHRSLVAGKMHACGHDGHSSMLLGAALYLNQHRNWNGTINFIFQPAEESYGGGKVMLQEGLKSGALPATYRSPLMFRLCMRDRLLYERIKTMSLRGSTSQRTVKIGVKEARRQALQTALQVILAEEIEPKRITYGMLGKRVNLTAGQAMKSVLAFPELKAALDEVNQNKVKRQWRWAVHMEYEAANGGTLKIMDISRRAKLPTNRDASKYIRSPYFCKLYAWGVALIGPVRNFVFKA